MNVQEFKKLANLRVKEIIDIGTFKPLSEEEQHELGNLLNLLLGKPKKEEHK